MDSDFARMVPFIALSSAIIFAAIMWFVLTKLTAMVQGTVIGVAALLGGVDYFLLRYVFNKVIQSQERE